MLAVDRAARPSSTLHTPARAARQLNSGVVYCFGDARSMELAFGAQFGVDITVFDASLHFGPEAGGNPLVWLWWSLTRSWPKVVPITVADLAAAAHTGRWQTPTQPPRPAITNVEPDERHEHPVVRQQTVSYR